jgi:beta-RFAP synthase
MFSFGNPELPQFGGVGAMIDRPRVELWLHAAETFSATGPLAERAVEIGRRVWSEILKTTAGEPLPIGCRIEVKSAPPQHAGLGVGTQLSLAIAAGLLELANRPAAKPAELAILAERGLRSAVGTYGFASGGLIVEAGKRAEERLSPLVTQVELPPDWRFVLLLSPAVGSSLTGLSGEREREAFAKLPGVPRSVTDALCREALLNLIPAARTADFARFSAALYRYGLLAGECFATCQGGPFASSALARLVQTIQRLGIVGVGQSSWGPTLFALVENQAAATKLIVGLSTEPAAENIEFLITAPAASGATVQALAESVG